MKENSTLVKSTPVRPEFATASPLPVPDVFTGDIYLIFDQADWVEALNLGDYNDSLGRERWFMVFSRRVLVPAPEGFASDGRGMLWGEEVVAYTCDSAGYVSDWDTRLEMRAHTYPAAIRKLRVLLINCMANFVAAPIND